MRSPELGSRLACLAASLFALASLTCSPPPTSEEGRLIVAVSINPLADWAGAVGGERVEVVRLVPPGASPHTYEPTPSQIAQLRRARLLLVVGMGLEFWAKDLVRAADNPRLTVVDTSKNVEPIDSNPHVWLDPVNAMGQVELVRDALIRVDPEGEEPYRSQAGLVLDRLKTLHQDVARETETWSERAFVAFHPAWVYFARRYGLEQAAVVEETPGHEPSAAEMAHIIEAARRVRVPVVFAEPQFNPDLAEAIARETGAKVLFLDPLGGALAPSDYEGLIRYNLQTMAQAMK